MIVPGLRARDARTLTLENPVTGERFTFTNAAAFGAQRLLLAPLVFAVRRRGGGRAAGTLARRARQDAGVGAWRSA